MSSADDYMRADPALSAYLASMSSPGGSFASPAGHALGQVVSAVSYSYAEEDVAAAPVASEGRKKKRKAKRDPNKPKVRGIFVPIPALLYVVLLYLTNALVHVCKRAGCNRTCCMATPTGRARRRPILALASAICECNAPMLHLSLASSLRCRSTNDHMMCSFIPSFHCNA